MILAIIGKNPIKSLEKIDSKKTGAGQYGTARWATRKEMMDSFICVNYTPKDWRENKNRPKIQGTILAQEKTKKKSIALVDIKDNHTLVVASAGSGKTTCLLYPNIELCLSSGMSFLSLDTKGDIFRNYGTIAKKYYNYDISVINLRDPMASDSFNMLTLVNHYMDLYKKENKLSYKAKSEKYAKIISKIIIDSSGVTNYGQNSYFYDSAEGIITAVILLVAEFGEKEERHIVTVYKLILELLEPSEIKDKTYFNIIMDKLPDEHKSKWYAGSALSNPPETMRNVMSTTLSKISKFLDTELEQILCFDNCINIENFCNKKSAFFIVLPEEDNTKYFLVSLIVQQLYREILVLADEMGGKLKNRIMFYLDEFGTIPKIENVEMMFSAIRSRNVSIFAIIQSFGQLEKTYGKESSEIILDNCQNSIFSGFTPTSKTADRVSKILGNQTILSGRISSSGEIGRNGNNRSYEMISRPLMTPDELRRLPKFNFIVICMGKYPIKTVLSLYFDWGITFEKPYKSKENRERIIMYGNRNRLNYNINLQYCMEDLDIKESETAESFENEKTEREKNKNKKESELSISIPLKILSDKKIKFK